MGRGIIGKPDHLFVNCCSNTYVSTKFTDL